MSAKRSNVSDSWSANCRRSASNTTSHDDQNVARFMKRFETLQLYNVYVTSRGHDIAMTSTLVCVCRRLL